MNRTQLPIGVVLPTLNARELLPAHLATMQPWIETVAQIIVVDSGSSDGSVDYLKQSLHHPALSFHSHPPGLYESWNHGIQQVNAEYVYISTIGDLITLDGLQHLVGVAETLKADVVISPPQFVSRDGAPVQKRWPIHDACEWLGITHPVLLQPVQTLLLSILDAPEGILGSSASNLYRTRTLQKYPFPYDCGHVGDTGWAIRHAFQATLAVTPKIISRFLIHASAGMMSDAEKESLVRYLFAIARKTLLQPGEEGQVVLAENLRDVLRRFLEEISYARECQEKYDRARHEFWPWILNPHAWYSRCRRNRQRLLVRQFKQEILNLFGLRANQMDLKSQANLTLDHA